MSSCCCGSFCPAFTAKAGVILYTFQSSVYSTNMEHRFQPEMKPQPMKWEPKAMIWPTSMGARMLVSWSMIRTVAFMSAKKGGGQC